MKVQTSSAANLRSIEKKCMYVWRQHAFGLAFNFGFSSGFKMLFKQPIINKPFKLPHRSCDMYSVVLAGKGLRARKRVVQVNGEVKIIKY